MSIWESIALTVLVFLAVPAIAFGGTKIDDWFQHRQEMKLRTDPTKPVQVPIYCPASNCDHRGHS